MVLQTLHRTVGLVSAYFDKMCLTVFAVHTEACFTLTQKLIGKKSIGKVFTIRVQLCLRQIRCESGTCCSVRNAAKGRIGKVVSGGDAVHLSQFF